ncbi:hypothetical protein [Calothrix sp. UHCC 0171]|uniref:hypothetical protein n=1 Tax=Calothrix sp. UHCC 0171 TaxID=3110245 RepID=UPI002B1F5B21|nr:hypothetical protein [Calothrix sp. UHCC 0171]MEA5570658.1 hypothetical protein [Calothrix sp. UHCC 0171]
MLINAEVISKPLVENLLNLWAQRYTINLASEEAQNLLSNHALLKAISPQGRSRTVQKLNGNILNINCQMALIQTKSLYTYKSNTLDLSEAKRISQFTFRIYKKIVDIYQNHHLEAIVTATEELLNNSSISMIKVIGIPNILELSSALEPTLLIFQEQHIISKDWCSLGFMTTHLNFCNQLILNKLEPAEKFLFTPYLKFLEEQVAIPWQRVCVAASKDKIDFVKRKLVQEMLPKAHEIADAAYYKLLNLLPRHHSRRGLLDDKRIKHSCIRDLNMFQAYFWLCFLEETVAPVEQELLPLCVMVVEGMNIQWELTQKWCEVLAVEMMNHLTPESKHLLQPCWQNIQEVFWQQRHNLGCRE